MAVKSISVLARQLYGANAPDEATDGQLLARFATEREAGGGSGEPVGGSPAGQAAFAELVRRHGPMVLGACRRVTGNAQDAEDAFQATFLVLARKARGAVDLPSVGGWLHGVAHRAALKARATAARRRAHETAAAVRSEGAEAMTGSSDVLAVIEQELGRLPKRYREPLVLCGLCGRSRKDVADELGVPEGTLSSRLAKAREMLAERLRRRGLVVPATVAAVVSETAEIRATVPAALADATVKVATGAVPAAVGRIASEVTRAMMLNKYRAGALVLVAVVLASAAGLGGLSHGAAPSLVPGAPTVPVANRAEKPGEIKTKELQEKVAAAKKNLEGVWERQKQVVDDKDVELGLGHYRYTFAEHTLRIDAKHIGFNANRREEITAEVELNYTINPTTNPPQLTAYTKDSLQMSIYEVSGDTLKIARHGSAELERPRGFALQDKRVTDLPLTVWEFKRKK